MRKFVGTGLMLTALCTGAVAWAQGDTSSYSDNTVGNPGGTDTTNVTQASQETVGAKGYMKDAASINPQVGVVGYQDPNTGSSNARAVYGLTADINVMPMISQDLGNIFVGPTLGALYSHLGDPGGGFFGSTTGSVNAGQGGANLLILPLDLKVGYAVTDWFRASAHGGGNFIYRSVVGSLALGNDQTASSSNWNIYPNVGADFEFALGKNVALGIRPDFTLTPVNDIYTGTLSLNIGFG
ncbi:MAG: hypothetical protein ACXVBW_07860 [Bdellovibrionota bacterium]